MTVDPVTIAITLALTAAQMALTASQNIEGPRLSDLSATSASYGAPLNYIYGDRVVTLPVMACEPIREHKHKRKTKGGKYSEFTYFGTWWNHVADHLISSVERVWFDSHLVISPDGSIFELADDYEIANSVTLYVGTEDQDQDPRLLAYIESLEGPDTCPAYRGTAYIGWIDIPLEKIGNRFPQVTAEVNAAGLPSFVEFEITPPAMLVNWPTGHTPDDATPFADIDFTYTCGDTECGPWLSDPDIDTGLAVSTYPAYTITWDLEDFTGLPEDAATTVLTAARTTKSGVFYVRIYTSITASEAPDQFSFVVSGLASDWDEVDPLTYTVRQRTEGGDWVTLAVNSQVDPYIDSPFVLGVDIVVKEMTFTSFAADVGDGADPVTPSLATIVRDVSDRCGLIDGTDFDCTELEAIPITGFNAVQGQAKNWIGPLLDLYDCDCRPHDGLVEFIRRGSSPTSTLETRFFKREGNEVRYKMTVSNDTDIPRRATLNFADIDADQEPNNAVAKRQIASIDSTRELTLDMTTLALTSSEARQLVERRFRREWFARTSAEFSLTRLQTAIEPGDVHTIDFDGVPMIMRCTKLTFGANGVLQTEWAQDDPALAIVPAISATAGAVASGIPISILPIPSETHGFVLDTPYHTDAHDQSALILYLAAGPVNDDDAWFGADFVQSETGDADTYTTSFDAIDSTSGVTWGTVTGTLGDAVHDVIDDGPVMTVVTSSALTSITRDQMLNDATLNLAAVGNETDGWEIIQFQTATLVATDTYEISGRIRGARGTEHQIATHNASDSFVMLSSVVRRHSMGASEMGDTDYYKVIAAGASSSASAAITVEFQGNSHRPYSPTQGTLEQSGADWVIDAVRRTRLGGSSVNGSDVPLGEASESWEVDIYDGADIVRTLANTSLPITYDAATQTIDFGSPQSSLDVVLYQINPTLTLRGFPLAIAA